MLPARALLIGLRQVRQFELETMSRLKHRIAREERALAHEHRPSGRGVVGHRRQWRNDARASDHALLELMETCESVGAAEVVPACARIVLEPADDVPMREV